MKKRWKILICLLVICAVGVAAVFFVRSSTTVTGETQTVAVQAGIGERTEYAQLTAVRGNEITYLLAEESGSASTEKTEEKEGRNQQAREEGMSRDGSGMPNMGSGEMSGMGGNGMSGMGSGEMPDMGSNGMSGMESGGMPDMGSMMSGTGEMFGNMSGMGYTQNQTTDDGTFTYNNVIYNLTETEVTELIPVGTEVTTKLGTVTTFSRLRAGDNVAIVRDKDSGEITAVYIIG